MACSDVIIMEEILKQRQTELEVVAKNTIVEIYMIKEEIEKMTSGLKTRERQLGNVNAVLQELVRTSELAKAEKKKLEAENARSNVSPSGSE